MRRITLLRRSTRLRRNCFCNADAASPSRRPLTEGTARRRAQVVSMTLGLELCCSMAQYPPARKALQASPHAPQPPLFRAGPAYCRVRGRAIREQRAHPPAIPHDGRGFERQAHGAAAAARSFLLDRNPDIRVLAIHVRPRRLKTPHARVTRVALSSSVRSLAFTGFVRACKRRSLVVGRKLRASSPQTTLFSRAKFAGGGSVSSPSPVDSPTSPHPQGTFRLCASCQRPMAIVRSTAVAREQHTGSLAGRAGRGGRWGVACTRARRALWRSRWLCVTAMVGCGWRRRARLGRPACRAGTPRRYSRACFAGWRPRVPTTVGQR